MDGEGLIVEKSAPAWFTSEFTNDDKVRWASLGTPEGQLWIRYSASERSCSIGANPTSKEAFLDGFKEGFPHAAGEWKNRKLRDENDILVLSGKIRGDRTRWAARLWNGAEDSSAVIAEMTAD